MSTTDDTPRPAAETAGPAAPGDGPVLRLESVRKTYGRGTVVLRDVDLEVPRTP